MKTYSPFNYKGYFDCDCVCDIYHSVDPKTGKDIILAAARDDNKGTSITNAVEGLITQFANQHGLDLDNIIWFEHYPREKSDWQAPTWDRVIFSHDGEELITASWRRMKESELDLVAELFNISTAI